jgi:UDP-glucose:(heptosyl)LPS alpha-1,3-glucosyltransferase
VVYPGTDISFFSPDRCKLIRGGSREKLGINSGEFVMAFVGSGFFRKGLPQAISLVSKLKRQGIITHLLVAGRDRISRFSRIASEQNCQAEVHFLGQVDNVLSIYAASDLLLLPSLYEPYGLSPLEAMSCGKPIIITKQCGIAELLENGREGLLLNSPKQTDPAVSFIAELLVNPSLKEAIGRSARETAEKLSAEIYAKNLTAVYEQAAKIPWTAPC